jgi:peptidoglycan/LPS O-acetylase OafA/YrhL
MAILLVIASHLGNRKDLLFDGVGQFGVWLFFILSAFLLSLYFFEQPLRARAALEWANYALRRFLRIYPAYTVALLIGAGSGSWALADLPAALALWRPTYWAVYVECRFYFLLPLVVLAFLGLGRVHKALPPIATLAAIAVHFVVFPAGSTVPGYEIDRPSAVLSYEYLIVFVVGTLAAWAYVEIRSLTLSTRGARLVNAVLLLIALAPWVAAHRLLGFVIPLAPYYSHLHWVPWSIMFGAMIFGVMTVDGPARRLFASDPIRFFGNISFSLYLFSEFVIAPLDRAIDNPALFVAAVAATAIPACYASFALIERPLSRISLKRLLSSRRDAPCGAVVVD